MRAVVTVSGCIHFVCNNVFVANFRGNFVVKLGVERIANSGLGVITAVSELHALPEVFGDDSGGVTRLLKDDIAAISDKNGATTLDGAQNRRVVLIHD